MPVKTKEASLHRLGGGGILFPAGGQPPPERVTVTGRVLEAGTDRPAVGVTVVLSPKEGEMGGESAQAVTDEGGRFSLEVAEGPYTLFLGSSDHRSFSQELNVTPGMEPLTLMVKRLPRIRGQLRQADGTPLANMQVDIHWVRLDREGGWVERRSVTTDEGGRYEVPVQQPGRCLLTVRVPALGYARAEVNVADVEVEGVDLQLAPGASLAGRVRVRRTEEVPRQVSLSLVEWDGPIMRGSYFPQIDEESRFLLPNLPPGNYQVLAYGRDYLRPLPQPLTLALDQAVTDFLVEVSPAPVLSGRLLAPDGTPLAGREVEFEAFTLQDENNYVGWGGNRLALDANGGFTLWATEAGLAHLFIRLAGVGYLIQTLEVREGSDFSGLEWPLKPFLTVTGRVREKRTQRPLADAQVTLWQQTRWPLPGLPAQAVSGADGRFELRDLIGGDYTVYCNIPGYYHLNPERIRLVPGVPPEELLLELERGTPVVGRVLGPDGRTPLEGAHVFIRAEQPMEQITDAEGRFAFEGVVWGDWLQVQAEGALVSTSPIPWVGPLPAGLSVRFASVREDGTYALEHLAPGEYTLSGSVPGYSETALEHVVVREGETTAGVDWTLTAEEEQEGKTG